MTRDGRDRGYLFVSLIGCYEAGDVVVLLEFLRANPSKEGAWLYGDRADPQRYDTLSELESGRVDWYGWDFSVRWLEDTEGEELRNHFEPPRSKPAGWKSLFRLWKSVITDKPEVESDSSELLTAHFVR